MKLNNQNKNMTPIDEYFEEYKEELLIADFLELEVSPDDDTKYRFPHMLGIGKVNPMTCARDYCEWADTYNEQTKENPYNIGYELTLSSFEFKKSWDWLMFVIEKIEELGYLVNITSDICTITYDKHPTTSGTGKLDGTYKAVIKFIKWYNKNKK